MRRLIIWLVASLLLAGATPALAEDAKGPWRINNIPLDLPFDEELNGEYLEGIYQEKLMDRLLESMLSEWPSYHIQSVLKGGAGKISSTDKASDEGNERMELYFSSAADHRRLFWIRTTRSMDGAGGADDIARALQMIELGFAKPDRIVTDAERPGNAIVIVVDTSLPPAEQDRLRAALPDPLLLGHEDFVEFWSMDLQQRAKILGPDFRGGIAVLNSFQGKLQSMQLELLDLKRAQTVFNLATP